MRYGDDGRFGEQSDVKGNVILTNRKGDEWNIGLRAEVGMGR
jgi:hypothetical protein